MTLSHQQKKIIRSRQAGLSVKKISQMIHAEPPEVSEYITSWKAASSARQHRLFSILLLLLPVVFFGLLEAGLRIFNYGGNLNLFVSAPEGYTQYDMCNQQIGRRFFSRQKSTPTPPFDLFLRQKPANGYRIFVLGGSTAAGYPYGNNLMFSRILQRRLSDAFPDRTIEVINVSMAAINSYALMDFTDEILARQPDALLIYAGHNEYYGALGVGSSESLGKYRWMVRLYLQLKKLKTFLLIRDGLLALSQSLTSVVSGGGDLKPSASLMERLVAEQQISYGSDLYRRGLVQFRDNLTVILRKARRHQVPVLLSDLVSNVRDQSPFISVSTTDYPPANEVYRQARQLENDGQFEAAAAAYYQAKDLDALRFRASEELNDVIHKLCGQFKVPIVPMKAFFEQASPHRLIGNNLMLEHLHPNIDGYFLMAEAFFQAMRENGMIDPEWNSSLIRDVDHYRQNWGYTALDSLYGNLRIHILRGGWPFQEKAAPNRALLNYRPRSREDSLAVKLWQSENYTLEKAHVELAEYYERTGDYRRAFREYRALMYVTPFNVSPYLRAADTFLKSGNLAAALPLLYESLQREETAFAHKWIGQILLEKNERNTAVQHLERSYQLHPSDPQLLFNLSGAYALLADYKKSRAMLDRLSLIAPDFPEADQLRAQLDRILQNPPN